jgi:hypothetical protein
MKTKFLIFFTTVAVILLCNSSSFAQIGNDSSLQKISDTHNISSPKKNVDSIKRNNKPDTIKELKRQKAIPRSDTIKRNTFNRVDSQKIKAPNLTSNNDSITKNKNDLTDTLINSTTTNAKPASFLVEQMLLKNRFINVKDSPVFLKEQPHEASGKEFLFYSLCIIVLILGIFKTFYSTYFKNLFRVYFNTSLRQTQLADQLVQAKLPSFILNIFFTITAGIYFWLLFSHYHPSRLGHNKFLLASCILVVALLYFIKFCILKFTGWVSDIQQTTDNYIFVIFLVNKIVGILLVPIIILLAFLKPEWALLVADISFMILGLLFLSRYIKSYGALEQKIPLNPFHFVIFILAAEIVPLIIIYKVSIDYLL